MQYSIVRVIFWVLGYGLLTAGAAGSVLAAPLGNSEVALTYLNTLREQAGLAPLRPNPALARAAEDHARYLSRHRGSPHRQQPGLSGFTGRTVDDRAVVAGYPVRAVSENISLGQRDPRRSVDDLMSTLYHRFGFLDLNMTEVGVGEGLGSSRTARYFVYVMGNHYLAALCEGKAKPASTYPGGYSDQFCEDGRKVGAAQWAAATARAEQAGPDIVLWPPPGSDHALPAFYDEIPDPLPHHKVSGSVISVQFNPLSYPGAITVKRFDLWDQGAGRPLPPLLLMQQANDPNDKLTAHQFALFPVDRLHWGHSYRAEFEYDYGGRTHIKRWSFRTRTLPYPVTRIAASGGKYALPSGQTSALVIPPSLGRELYRQVRWSTPKGMRVDIDWEDDNTLLVKLRGKPCAEVELRFSNGFRLTVVEDSAAGCTASAGIGLRPSAPPPLPAAGRAAAPPSAPQRGNTILGKGELFTVRAGSRYVFSVKPTMVYPALGKIKQRSRGGASAVIERLDEHSLALRVTGKSGGEVTLDLGDGRYFKVVLE